LPRASFLDLNLSFILIFATALAAHKVQVHELRSPLALCLPIIYGGICSISSSLLLCAAPRPELFARMHACIMYNFTPVLAKVRLSFARAEKQLRDIFAERRNNTDEEIPPRAAGTAGDKTGIIYNVSYFQRGFAQDAHL
jgi:hypothetical protein